MKVKRLLQAQSLPYHMVAELIDGRFAKFSIVPAREITDKELTILPYYRAVGRAAEEAPEYMYQMYGLTKK